MPRNSVSRQRALLFVLLAFAGAQLPVAHATTCTTQAQMTPADRDTLAASARTIVSLMQSDQLQALQADTIPAVAANFQGIANSVASLKPLVQPATITIDELYLLDASGGAPGAAVPTAFYCGSPVVVFNFTALPPGTYALAIVHATGVPQPQQVSVILSKTGENRWMLAGFFDKPMIAAGHDGLWYWVSARKYAQSNDKWDAWLYYHMASDLLDPVSFLSSPNLDKLNREADQARPASLPGAQPLTLTVNGSNYTVTAVSTSTLLNWLDLDVNYTPDAAQAAQLSDPAAARQQVTAIMSALLELHPGLQSAFHGIWVHANQGNNSLFALELPMAAIAGGPKPPAAESTPAAH